MSNHSNAAILVSAWSLKNCSVSTLTVSRTSKGSSSDPPISTRGEVGAVLVCPACPACPACPGPLALALALAAAAVVVLMLMLMCEVGTGDSGRDLFRLGLGGNSVWIGVTGSEP